MLSIQTNYNSLVAQNNLGRSNSAMGTAMERLSTGFRINSAKDDAAGLQIANRLQAQSNGMNVAMRNSQDAISMMETAEGAMDELTNIAYRMKDLATQASSDTNGTSERDAILSEYSELQSEAMRILTETSYGAGEKLLGNGTFDAVAGTYTAGAPAGKFEEATGLTFQIGASSSETMTVNVSTELGAVATAFAGLANNADPGNVPADGTAWRAQIDSLDTIFDTVNGVRSNLGANINRLDHTINNLSNIVENTEAAKGRIMDTDFAVETANMTKNQLLVQAGTNILAQSNQMGGLVMGLL